MLIPSCRRQNALAKGAQSKAVETGEAEDPEVSNAVQVTYRFAYKSFTCYVTTALACVSAAWLREMHIHTDTYVHMCAHTHVHMAEKDPKPAIQLHRRCFLRKLPTLHLDLCPVLRVRQIAQSRWNVRQQCKLTPGSGGSC